MTEVRIDSYFACTYGKMHIFPHKKAAEHFYSTAYLLNTICGLRFTTLCLNEVFKASK